MSPRGRRRSIGRAAAAPFVRRASGIALVVAALASASAAEPNFPITPTQRSTAQQVAETGVPLAELAPNAPESYTVQRGDTLWGISGLYLQRPWRWPELWGMNLAQVRNPHLIYPGQVLVLEKSDGRARLRFGQAAPGMPDNTVRLSPRVRAELLDNGAIAAIPLHLIGPFLTEAVVFDRDELETAPRIVATQEGRVLVSRGERAYVRGDLQGAHEFRVFREPQPLRDPGTHEVLGYEARYVGTAELLRTAGESVDGDGDHVTVPATFVVTSARVEAGVGDRLSPVPPSDLLAYVPHAPAQPVEGRIVSVYGDGIYAGQNQIVAINRGVRDGIERGHVLALWRAGQPAVDRTGGRRERILLPDERHGLIFVFRVFDRVSYALIVSVQEPVRAGDRFTQP